MKRVLVYGMTDNLGGMETFMLSYIKNIPSENITFDFIAPYEKIAIEEDIIALGGKVFHLPNRKSGMKDYIKDFNSFMKENAENYDAVWLNDCMFCNLDILILAKRYGIKTRIIHAHNSEAMGSKSQLIRHTLNKNLIPMLATDFWACSDLAGKWSYPSSISKNNKFKVIPNAIDTAKYSYRPQTRELLRKDLGVEDNFVIGNVGRLHFQKNQEFMLDVFSEIVKEESKSLLWFIGAGEDEEKLHEKAKSLNIDDKVVFWGIRKDVPNMLQAMDVFLMPSKFEGLGIVSIEAQTTGLPCIMSDVIPQDTNVTNHTAYLSLDAPVQEWAKKVLSYADFKREDSTQSVKENGFDIKTASMELQKRFLDIIEAKK